MKDEMYPRSGAAKIELYRKNNNYTDTERGELVRDLLTNIRHYCELYDISFFEADQMAREHYMAEIEDQEEP